MTCFNNVRIYNEDEDTGYVVTLMEGLRNCMVFNDDGTPRQLEGMENPVDARDLESVFWLRPETDANGSVVFKNIEIMGDIDPTFFGPDNVASLARTMINAGLGLENVKPLEVALTQGAALVDRLARMPVTGGQNDIAGMVTFEGLTRLAGMGVAESNIATGFLAALKDVVDRLSPLLGGTANMFLNPANASGEGGAEQVLYENLFGYNFVPLVQTADQNVAIPTARLAEARATIKEALRGSSTNDGITPAAEQALGDAAAEYSVRLADLDELAGVRRMLDFIERNPVVADVKRAHPQIILQWVRELRSALSVTGGTQKAFSAKTDLAVHRDSKQLRSGDLAKQGFRPASRFGTETVQAEQMMGRIGSSFFEQTPIMQSLIAGRAQGGPIAGKRTAGTGRRGFESLFGDDDESAQIGTLFPGGAEGQLELDELNERRNRIAETGVVLGSGVDPRLRFGTLSHNLEQLNSFVANGLERVVATLYFAAPWKRQTLESMLSRNIMPNFGIIGFRIGLYDMALGIKVRIPPVLTIHVFSPGPSTMKCKAGSQTAFTAFGNSRFMLADDATTMAHYGNFTFYGKSIVQRPEDVFVAYDIFPNRCLGGMGVRPYSNTSQYNAAQGQAMRDIFYCMVPYRETSFDTIMDMAGRFYTYMDSGMLDDEDPANRELHYSTAGFYNRLWRWYALLVPPLWMVLCLTDGVPQVLGG